MQKLSLEEIREIYENRMPADFPPVEIKPFSAIASMYARGEYTGLAEMEDGHCSAYAFFVVCREPEEAVLLDYFAVDPNRRDRGIGSSVLSRLPSFFPGVPLLLESENPDYAADEADLVKRERRLSFYRRNRAMDTGVRSVVYGVEYVVLQLMAQGKEPVEAEARRHLTDIYRTMFSEEQRRTKVAIHPESGIR